MRQQLPAVVGDSPHKLRHVVRSRIAIGAPVRHLVHPLRLVVPPDVAWRFPTDGIPEIEQLAVEEAADVRHGRVLLMADNDRGLAARLPFAGLIEREAAAIGPIQREYLGLS